MPIAKFAAALILGVALFSIFGCSSSRFVRHVAIPERMFETADGTYTLAFAITAAANAEQDSPRDWPTLVFLHGIGACKETWRPLAHSLGEIDSAALPRTGPSISRDVPQAYRQVFIDLPGHGGSRLPPGFEQPMQSHARAVAELLAHLEIQNAIVVGASFGGGVALELARMDAQSANPAVHGLCLIAPTAYRFTPPPTMRNASNPLLRFLIVNFGSGAGVARLLLKASFADDRRIGPELLDCMANAHSQRKNRAGAADCARGLFREFDARGDDAHRYAGIRCPTLIVWGDADATVPRSVLEQLRAQLPQARVKIIAECGHTPHEERPDATAHAIADFLCSVPASRE